MDYLKDIFGDSEINYDKFVAAITEKGIKLADLSQGAYVSKNKYDDELNAKASQITELSEQIKSRNADLEALKEQLQGAQADGTKIQELNDQLAKLQKDYTDAEKKFNHQLTKQQYEFAVKEFANEQKFTSSAAKRDFIRTMMDKKLEMENGKIIGATDYLDAYKNENADAIAADEPAPEPEPDDKPKFVSKSGQTQGQDIVNPFLDAMHFNGVRPEKKE